MRLKWIPPLLSEPKASHTGGKGHKVGKQWFISRDWLDESTRKEVKKCSPVTSGEQDGTANPAPGGTAYIIIANGSGLIKFTYLTLFCFPGEFVRPDPFLEVYMVIDCHVHLTAPTLFSHYDRIAAEEPYFKLLSESSVNRFATAEDALRYMDANQIDRRCIRICFSKPKISG